MIPRVPFRGVLRNCRQYGAFGKRQILAVLPEVGLGGRLYTVGSGAEIDSIQVILKNDVLGILALCGQRFFQLDSQVLFLELPLDALKTVFLCPVCLKAAV